MMMMMMMMIDDDDLNINDDEFRATRNSECHNLLGRIQEFLPVFCQITVRFG